MDLSSRYLGGKSRHRPERSWLLVPFRIVCKKMELADGIEAVVKEHIPRLEHGHDGLIFTCAETGYVVGTDEMM